MQKCCSSSASIRVLYYMRNAKFISSFHVYFPRAVEVRRALDFSVCRIICTDIKFRVQSALQPKCQQTTAQETYCLAPFLKENFNITENRYFKLISVTNECQLEELLKKEELKEVISRSPFTFDVTLSNSTFNNYPMLSSFNTVQEMTKDSTLSYVTKPEYLKELILFSTAKENVTNSDKPSEKQLLIVINKLTSTLINFFEKPHDFSIYHKNIVFQNNLRGITTKGLTAYVQAMYILKFYGLFHYAKVKVEILKITHHIEDGTVRVRWRVNGISRHQQLVNLWKHKKLFVPPEDSEWIDGFSTFNVGADGLVYQHICDKITPDSDEEVVRKPSIKTKLLRLLDYPRQRPISLHTLASCYKNQEFTNYKRIT